jgi:hypothetical protein
VNNRTAAFLVALTLSVSCPHRAPGQRVTEALVGSRVRLETTNGAQAIGTIVSVDADSIRLESNRQNSPISLPRADVLSYDVSAGRERGRGAKRGAIVGGGLGLALVVASLRNDTATVHRRDSDLRQSVPIAVGITALGAGIGAALAPERWEPGRRTAARIRLVSCPRQCVALRYRF